LKFAIERSIGTQRPAKLACFRSVTRKPGGSCTDENLSFIEGAIIGTRWPAPKQVRRP
jgi:hypothetical protein